MHFFLNDFLIIDLDVTRVDCSNMVMIKVYFFKLIYRREIQWSETLLWCVACRQKSVKETNQSKC